MPQLHNPYPPLYPLLSAALHRLGVDAHLFSAGRFLSFIGLWLAAAGIFALIRRRGTWQTAFLGTLCFLLSPMILRFGPMMRVDSLALGFSLQALNLLDRQKLKSAALLAALALCVKPGFASAALTVAALTFMSRDVKKICLTALCGIAPLIALGLWIFLQPDSHGFLHLFTLQKLPFDPAATFSWIARFVGQHAPLLTLGAMAYRKMDGPLKIYAPLILLPLLLSAGISGSQENYLMELWAVTCVLAACAWPSIRETQPRAAWLILLLQLGLFFPVAPAPVFTRTYGQEIPAGQNALLTPTAADEEIGQLISAELSSLPGPVLCADLGYLFVSGHTPVYQPYQFENLSAAGRWSSRALHEAITQSVFSAILIKGPAESAGDPTFNLDTQALIDAHYILHRVIGPWHLYRPK